MAYILTTKIYKKPKSVETKTEFEEYGDAIRSAEHIADVLNNVMTLTRHNSCESSISHCGYYADSYNELFICIKEK